MLRHRNLDRTELGMDNKLERTTLAAGGLAAILASACCVGPLVLVSLGLGGAWMSNLRALGPFQPVFIGLALIAMFFAYRHIYRPAADCKPGEACAVPQVKTTYKLLFWIVAALILVALVFPLIAPLFY